MSARHCKRKLLSGLLLGVCGAVLAADNELPDGEFIQYLGSWEESDEEWLIFARDYERVAADSEERVDPAPQGEESTEKDDEG